MKTLKNSDRITRSAIIAGLFLVLFAGCRAYSVISTDYDKTVDFSSYRSFAWLPDKDIESSPYHNSVVHNNIKNYFSPHFGEFGYTPDTDSPDLLFEQVITSASRTETYQEQHPVSTPGYQQNSYGYNNYNYQSNPYYQNYGYSNYNSYNYNYNNRNYNNNYGYTPNRNYYANNSYYRQQYKTESHTRNYTESTITLNAIDRKQNKLVWTSTVQADIYDGQYLENDIHPAVRTMLKTFPAEKKKAEKKKAEKEKAEKEKVEKHRSDYPKK